LVARTEGEAVLAEAARHREDRRGVRGGPAIMAEERAAANAIALAAEQAEQEQAEAWASRSGGGRRWRRTSPSPWTSAAPSVTAIRGACAGRGGARHQDEVARQARTEITAADETARHMIADARARVAELADVRGRIAAQLRGTQAQLGTALDDLAPEALPAASPPPGVEPAPPVRALAPAPEAPALPAASGSNGQPAHDPAQADAEPDGEPDRSEQDPAEARRPTQRRRKRQNSASRR
jgi:hypothetical protein